MLRTALHDALDRLAGAVDPERLAAAERLQRDAWAFRPVERIPVLLLDVADPEWPLYPYREAFADPEKMFWNELLQVRAGVAYGDDRVLAVRAHYGSGTMASAFGARFIPIDDELPWIEPLPSRDDIRRLVDRGMPDLAGGLAGRALETESLYLDYLRAHPPLDRYVHVFLCDSQGPMDTAHLLWGQDIYIAMREEPELVHALLNLVTETTIAFMRRQKDLVGEPYDEAYHFWYRIPGGARVVDDVAINFSASLYEEFARPYNERVLAAFGGGYMHYCGHRLHSQPQRLATRGLRGIEMGFDNPERTPAYSLERIWGAAAERRVAILWVRESMPAERPGVDTGLVFALKQPALDWSEAPRFLDAARRFWANPAPAAHAG